MDIPEKLVTIAVQQSGPARTANLLGDEFTVLPAVLVRSQVLNNNLGRTFLPAEEVTDQWAQTFNHAPVLIDHPTERGVPVSGKSPSVLNAMGVGFVFNAHAEDGAVKGEVWLKNARAKDVPDLAAVLEKVAAGENAELSTGFPIRLLEEAPGVHNGRQFDRVLRPGPGDHLAVFARKVGACSVTDGCGLGVNHDGSCDPPPAQPEPPVQQPAAKEPGVFARLMARVAAALGISNESDEDRTELLRNALQEKFGRGAAHIWIAATFSDEGQVVFERWSEMGGPAGLFRVSFEIGEDGSVTFGDPEEVRRVTTFQPIANANPGAPTPQEGTMTKDQMIAFLAAQGRDKEALAKLSDCDLKALHAAAQNGAEPTPKDAEDRAWQARALEYRAELDELKAKTANALNAEAEERISILNDLLYKGRAVAWNEAELKAMDIVELRKVYRQVFNTADYSGRGGPKTSASVGSFDWLKPMSVALSEKEN